MIDPIAAHSFQSLFSTLAESEQSEKAVQNIDAAVTVNQAEKPLKPTYDRAFTKPLQDQPFYEHERSSLDKAIEQLNSSMQAWATGMRFDIDPDTQRIVLTLVDNDSGDVIRTVPSEAVLAIAKMITQFQGQSINTKA